MLCYHLVYFWVHNCVPNGYVWPKIWVEYECKLDFFLQVIHTYLEIKIVIDTDDNIGKEIRIECMGVYYVFIPDIIQWESWE